MSDSLCTTDPARLKWLLLAQMRSEECGFSWKQLYHQIQTYELMTIEDDWGIQLVKMPLSKLEGTTLFTFDGEPEIRGGAE